jgi:hypothetical protein
MTYWYRICIFSVFPLTLAVAPATSTRPARTASANPLTAEKSVTQTPESRPQW